MPDPKWETVHKVDEFRKEPFHHLQRIAVPGGWLYHSTYIHHYGDLGKAEHLACNVTFVPSALVTQLGAQLVEPPAVEPPPVEPKFMRRARPTTTGDAA